MSIESILQTVFGYSHFRGPQHDIIAHVTGGGDALVLMPTGGGKSLCYQIPAIARQQAGQGITVVISPLIALMHDQVGALHEAGVSAAFLNSTLTMQEASDIERRLVQGNITLLYAAPERINTPRFLAQLDSLYERGRLSLFAIDEAHCVSQWGHDFRPEYRALTVLHERYSQVPRIALTATADALTRADIIERLQLQDARLFVSSFDRPNIRYTIVGPSCHAGGGSKTPTIGSTATLVRDYSARICPGAAISGASLPSNFTNHCGTLCRMHGNNASHGVKKYKQISLHSAHDHSRSKHNQCAYAASSGQP